MRFLFTTFNHGRQGKIILEDVTGILGHQLRALGHDVFWGDVFIEHGWNVVIESFADNPATLQKIGDAYRRGFRFVYIATEEPSPQGFNHGLDPGMIDRQNAFPEAAQFCSGILHLIPGADVNRWYAQFAPAAHAEIGYAPGFVVEWPDDIDPTHAFGFYGKMTWRRDQILRTLEAMTKTEVLKLTTLDIPRNQRDATMMRARVILQVRANLEWGMVSSTRCATALGIGRPVVAEPHPFAAPWDEVLTFSKSVEAFYDDAIAAAAGDWRGLHAEQMARFKDRLTPERCIGEPLCKIGIL